MSDAPLWLRGPVSDVPHELQGVAHGLLETLEEVKEAVKSFSAEKLWIKPFGVASVGFHLQHLSGATDRLFTIARGEELSEKQAANLVAEQRTTRESGDKSLEELVSDYERVVDACLAQLRSTDISTLTESRSVGRRKLPSTAAGLLEHAAQHAYRHTGQIVTTVKIHGAMNT